MHCCSPVLADAADKETGMPPEFYRVGQTKKKNCWNPIVNDVN